MGRQWETWIRLIPGGHELKRDRDSTHPNIVPLSLTITPPLIPYVEGGEGVSGYAAPIVPKTGDDDNKAVVGVTGDANGLTAYVACRKVNGVVTTGEDRVGDDKDGSSRLLLLLFSLEEMESCCVSEEMGAVGEGEDGIAAGLYLGHVPYRTGVTGEVNIASYSSGAKDILGAESKVVGGSRRRNDADRQTDRQTDR